MTSQQTISDSYLALQRELHKNPNYGVASLHYAGIVNQVMQQSGARSLSDYGAGKKNLLRGLHELGKTNFEYLPYDPAFPDYGSPKPGDLVCCIDVLEHIEPSFLDSVLLDLRRITEKLGFFSVHCGPAIKTLPDGRNAHLIQQQPSWWLPKLSQYFEVRHMQSDQHGFWVLVERRRDLAQ